MAQSANQQTKSTTQNSRMAGVPQTEKGRLSTRRPLQVPGEGDLAGRGAPMGHGGGPLSAGQREGNKPPAKRGSGRPPHSRLDGAPSRKGIAGFAERMAARRTLAQLSARRPHAERQGRPARRNRLARAPQGPTPAGATPCRLSRQGQPPTCPNKKTPGL